MIRWWEVLSKPSSRATKHRIEETQPQGLTAFSGVPWEGDKPLVKVGKKWFKLVSLDRIAVEKIVAFSKRTYGGKWQKRFAEDLVEVLARMDYKPEDTVELVVQPLDSKITKTLKNIAMTQKNRNATRDARNRAEE